MKEISAKDHMDLLMNVDDQNTQDAEENLSIHVYPKAMVADALEMTVTQVNRLVQDDRLTPVSIRFASDRERTFICLDRLYRYEYQRLKDIKSKEDMDYTVVKRELIRLAGKGDVIVYSDLLNLIGYKFATYYKKKMNDLLLRISEESYKTDGYLLSALVVKKNTHRPVPSLYRLAVSMGLIDDCTDAEVEEVFFEQQKTMIYERAAYLRRL